MKKILSMMLSLALVSASFVTAMAEGKPYVSYEIGSANPQVLLDSEVATEEDLAELPAGTNFYEVVVDFHNLPDLTYGSKSGADGTRLSTFNLKFATDLNNIKGVWGVNSDEAEAAEELDCVAGILDSGLFSFAANAIDNAISVVCEATKKANCFPASKADQDADEDGTLASAVVFYVAALEEPVFTSVFTDANILYNNDFDNLENTMVTEFFAGVAGNVNSDNSYNVGVEKKQMVNSPVTEAVFNFLAADGSAAEYTVALPTTVSSGLVAVALNVTNVPAGVTFQYTGAAIQ